MSRPDNYDTRRGLGSWWAGSVGLVLLLIGLVLAAGGAWLIALGGSWYYLPAGLGLILAGALMMSQRRSGALVYDRLAARPRLGLLGGRPRRLGAGPAPWHHRPPCPGHRDTAGAAAPADPRRGRFARPPLARIAAAPGRRRGDVEPGGRARARSRPDESGPGPRAGHRLACLRRLEPRVRYSPLAQITARKCRRPRKVWKFRTGDMPDAGRRQILA